jgi:mono/diheme cytochrome c family protein
MWKTNLKILGIVLGTLALYTILANSIPQIESEVPQELTFGANATPEQLVAAGEPLYNSTCTQCHGLGTRAPNLLTDDRGAGTIGQRCGSREAGKNCKEYLHESLVQPTKFVVPGFQPIMPDFSKTMSPAQIWSLVAFLQSSGGEVTVTGEDIGSATAAPAAAAAAAPTSTATDPQELIKANACLGCHKIGSEGAALGPDLSHIGARADASYIRRAILNPDADVAKGFEAMKGVMPKTFGQQLTAAQLESIVDYLSSLK